MTVADLIERLKEYPPDMPVAVWSDIQRSREDHKPYSNIEITRAVWVYSNYPWDEKDFEYVNLR